jgi:vacuolar-type H+-ATPase subunit E/Vma4
MAIKIPILTSFDPKGLKQANAAFAGLQGSVRSLGSNFAAVGVALAGAGALIAKNVESLARIERINAQTGQTIKSMGNAANISAVEVEALAGQLEKLTATEAESIQEGANLLLTFRNISNQAGAGNDIFNQTTAIMVDMGRALGEDAAGSAIRLGKALNDPITGLTALRKVGVGFTEEQEAQIKALQNSGDMMGAQKVILAELQAQFGGSGAAYAKTFSGQLDLMGHELGTIGEEATMAVMPALQGMIEQLRLLIPEIGPKLKAAIESIDWKALTTSIVNLTTFFIENIETIGRLVAAIFILNTAFKLMAVASGIAKTAIALQTWFTAQLAAGMTIATVASNILRIALMLTPWGLLAVGIGLVIVGITQLGDKTREGAPYVDAYGGAIRRSGAEAEWAAGKYGAAAAAVGDYTNAVAKLPDVEAEASARNRELDKYMTFLGTRAATATTQLQNLSGALSGVATNTALSEAQSAAAAAAAAAAARRQERLERRKRALESFVESVKSLFSSMKESILSSFDLPSLGNSVNAITRNISKLLEKTRSFAKNITELSGLGLNSTLLQQVIQAGPMAGGQLAAALVGGGSAFIDQLNASYAEFGGLASGIAQTGTTGAFANAQTVNNYSIAVTGGVATSADVGRAVVNAITSFERQSGAAWRA